MCSILQKNFGWPTTGTHRCYNMDCDQIIDCRPNNTALCGNCHSRYHKSECSTCPNYYTKPIFPMLPKLVYELIDLVPLTEKGSMKQQRIDSVLLGHPEISLRSQRRQKNRLNKLKRR